MPVSLARDKGSIVSVPLVNFSLPVPPAEVIGTEVLTTVQCVWATVDFRERDNNELICVVVVHTELHGAILFTHHHHIR